MVRPPYPDDPAQFLKALRRRSFVAFLERAWPHICGGALVEWNWHIDAIAHRLDLIKKGQSRRLLVNLPPRNGKSNIISIIWVAWMLGIDPTLNFVCVSYANDQLSAKLARDCLSIMQADWYQEIFPRTKISRQRSAVHDFRTTMGGGRLATSVTGTITGRGGDIIILDDVIKPEDASSETARNNVNDWYRSTLISRLDNKSKGVIICVMQRLHQFDLSGLLIESGGWDHLSLPAIAAEDAEIPLTRKRVYHRKQGAVLHPKRESRADLNLMRAEMGSTLFSAQYLQDPVPADGNVFKAAWFKVWLSDFDPGEYGEVIQSWDTGIKIGETNDWSVCVTAVLRQKNLYIIDVWRGRVEFPQLRDKAVDLARLHRADTLLIEDKASGQQLVQTLRGADLRGVPEPIAINPEADKLSRAVGVSSMVEAGQVFLPPEGHWLGEFKSEVLAFPNGRYDDQVDAFSQLLTWVRTRLMFVEAPLVGPTLYIFDNKGNEIDVIGEDYSGDEFDGDPWDA